jgi:hypothetical protein
MDLFTGSLYRTARRCFTGRFVEECFTERLGDGLVGRDIFSGGPRNMLIVMHRKATKKQIGAVLAAVERMGLTASRIPGSERTATGSWATRDTWRMPISGISRGSRK